MYALGGKVLALVAREAKRVTSVRISETMRINRYDGNEAVGVWDEASRQVVVKRTQLRAAETFLATLLHEIGHAYSGAPDVDELFEDALTHLLGRTGAASVKAAT